MESKEPTQEKIIEAVKKYYGLKIDENAYHEAQTYMHTKKQPQMVILYML